MSRKDPSRMQVQAIERYLRREGASIEAGFSWRKTGSDAQVSYKHRSTSICPWNISSALLKGSPEYITPLSCASAIFRKIWYNTSTGSRPGWATLRKSRTNFWDPSKLSQAFCSQIRRRCFGRHSLASAEILESPSFCTLESSSDLFNTQRVQAASGVSADRKKLTQ